MLGRGEVTGGKKKERDEGTLGEKEALCEARGGGATGKKNKKGAVYAIVAAKKIRKKVKNVEEACKKRTDLFQDVHRSSFIFIHRTRGKRQLGTKKKVTPPGRKERELII